jgi:hypothetical protein
LLNEDNPNFRRSILKDEILKSQISKASINNVKENKKSQIFFQEIKEEKEHLIDKPVNKQNTLKNSILRASTVSRKNTSNLNNPFSANKDPELNKESYDEKVESNFKLF